MMDFVNVYIRFYESDVIELSFAYFLGEYLLQLFDELEQGKLWSSFAWFVLAFKMILVFWSRFIEVERAVELIQERRLRG